MHLSLPLIAAVAFARPVPMKNPKDKILTSPTGSKLATATPAAAGSSNPLGSSTAEFDPSKPYAGFNPSQPYNSPSFNPNQPSVNNLEYTDADLHRIMKDYESKLPTGATQGGSSSSRVGTKRSSGSGSAPGSTTSGSIGSFPFVPEMNQIPDSEFW